MRTTNPIRFKNVSSGDTIAGYASIFGEKDLAGDVVTSGAFSQSISDIASAGHKVPMLWGHDQSNVLGSWSSLQEDAVGLHVEGAINTAVEKGREALALVKARDLSGLSIGFQVAGAGRTIKNGIPHLTRLNLLEVSLVAVPAAPKARITLKDFGDLSQYAEFLQDVGMSRRESEYVARKSWPSIAAGGEPEIEIDKVLQHVKSLAQDWHTKFNMNHDERGRFSSGGGGGSGSGGEPLSPTWADHWATISAALGKIARAFIKAFVNVIISMIAEKGHSYVDQKLGQTQKHVADHSLLVRISQLSKADQGALADELLAGLSPEEADAIAAALD